ncbi:MAG: MaoC/PaaZ C-terminal domain-containing protein [Acidimicrobiales bacterium]|nr:MaoC/PaaZ C-terminal domain-containing protein [Acidimicrobiales bacterium]
MTDIQAQPADLVVGAKPPEYLEGPLTRIDIVRYAGAGGDFNPIHHDDTRASALSRSVLSRRRGPGH